MLVTVRSRAPITGAARFSIRPALRGSAIVHRVPKLERNIYVSLPSTNVILTELQVRTRTASISIRSISKQYRGIHEVSGPSIFVFIY